MNLFRAALLAYRAGSEVRDAWAGAEAALLAGKGPLGALRALAAATSTQLDNEAVTTLEDGLRRGIGVLTTAVEVAAFIAAHEHQVRGGVEAVLGTVVDVGYRAGRWKATLATWGAE